MAYKQKHTNSTFPFKTGEKVTAKMKKDNKKFSPCKGCKDKAKCSKAGKCLSPKKKGIYGYGTAY